MKNRFAQWIALAMISTAPLMAQEAVNILDLNEKTIEEFWSGNFLNVPMEIPAGTEVIWNMSITGDVISLTMPENQTVLRVLKSYYVRYVEDEDGNGDFEFSFDQEKWGGLDTLTKGVCTATVTINDGRPVLSVSIEVNENKDD